MATGVRTMDPLAAYTNLTINLPQWIKTLDSLSEYATQKHTFFVAEYARLLAHAQSAKPKRVKSASMQSIHSTKSDDGRKQERPARLQEPETQPGTATSVTLTPPSPLATPNPTEISPFEPGNKYLYAQARGTRKRKPGSSIHSGASGPQKFRGKQMVIIYYDTYLQDQLDQMVKQIGASRNELRKAKASAAAAKGFQLPTLGRKFGSTLPSSPREGGKVQLSLSSKNVVDVGVRAWEEKQMDPLADATFALADRMLEAAQTLCETAAHQFLRDGDCRLELENAPKNLAMVVELATTAVRLVEAEEHKTADSAAAGEDTSPTETSSMRKSLEDEASSKWMPPAICTGFGMGSSPGQPFGLGTMEIEVDDGSDASTVEVDITRFRMARGARISRD